MSGLKRLIFATRNPHKVRELSEMMTPLGWTALPLSDGAPEVVEDADTFLGNAALKAISAYRHTGDPAVADDSGICLSALDGAPGILSARFAGPECDDAANNRRMLAELKNEEDRAAFYHCALACVMPRALLATIPESARADWPGLPEGTVLLSAEGQAHGRIIDQPRGEGGFGYDPYFYRDDLGKTFAELSADEKHALSHRGKAFKALVAMLQSHAA